MGINIYILYILRLTKSLKCDVIPKEEPALQRASSVRSGLPTVRDFLPRRAPLTIFLLFQLFQFLFGSA